MKGSPPRKYLAVIGTALLVSLLALSAFGQAQTGNIYGKTQAKDGSILPGVTVTLTGVGAPQTFVTDNTGAFRFLGLSPGTYSVKAELSGFGNSVRNGITVNVGRNADITMTLNPAAAESITVTAEAPLLDVRKTGDGANVTKVELQNVPSARDPWVILQQTPGILMDRNNVGGNESGQQSVYVSKGAVQSQATWNVDGVNITDFAATGSSPSYYDFDAFEEMQITTSGTDPRIQTPGAQLNMVTKRGTNDIKGSGRAFKTKDSWQSNPKIPAETLTYATPFKVNQISDINDDGGEVGGPILRDKLWFWAAFAKQQVDILQTTGAHDRTLLKNENAKINAQPLASNSLTAVDQYGAKIKLGRSGAGLHFAESLWNQNDYYNGGVGSLKSPTLWKIEDTQIIGSHLYLTGLYSKVQGGFQLISDNGQGCQSLACGAGGPVSVFNEKLGGWTRSYVSEVSNRPQKQYRLDSSAFANTGTISHELKFGWGYRTATVSTATAWPGSQWVDDYTGVEALGPNGTDTGVVHFMRSNGAAVFGIKTNDAYVGDTMMLGNLTVMAAIRYDQQKGFVDAAVSPANPNVPTVLPTINAPGVSGLSWSNISPRLGLTYTLGNDRRTLLRASYSRYVNQINSGIVTPVSPGAYAQQYFYFNDINKNGVADPNEIDFAAGGLLPPPATSASTARTRWKSGLSAPHTNELTAGVERELLTDFSIGVNGTYRKLENFVGTVGEHTQGAGDFYSSSDYTLAPNPIIATLPNGQTVTQSYYILKSGIPAAKYNVIRNTPDYYQTYKGLELTATKRMSNRWMLRGNLTLQNWQQHVGAGAIVDPSITRSSTGCSICNGSQVLVQSTGSGGKSSVYINAKWESSLTGTYQIPVIETALGFNLSSRQGYAIPYIASVRFTDGEGTKSILLENATDTFRNDNVTQLDLRLAKDLHLSRFGLTLSVDAFNVMNANTILQRNAGSVCSGS
ncbi:MAG TPA: TonB-dependent receptor, partial [Vicinamibacterales bacterium]